MSEFFLQAFVLLFVVVDPVGLAPIYASLTHGDSEAWRRSMAIRGVALAGLVLLVFALWGQQLLDWLRIELAAFRIAGGLLLFLLAVDMVFARHSGVRGPTPREQAEAEHRKDVSVFPLAIPLIAGPGAITTVLLLASSTHGSASAFMLLLLTVAAVLLLALASLLLASRFVRLAGETGANVVTRVFGIVLCALAVQFVLDGLRTTLGAA